MRLFIISVLGKEGKTIATQTIEAIEGPLDDSLFQPMVSVINRMPDDAGIRELSHPEIRSELEGRDILFGIRYNMGFPHSLGVIVALAGGVIEHDGKTIRVTEIAANNRAEDEATYRLMDTFVAEAKGRGADELILDITPQQGTTAADFIERYGFNHDKHGAHILKLSDVELDEPRG